MKNLFVKKNLIDCMCVFSNDLRQNNHELPLTCIANASSSRLTCPLHLFRKVLIICTLLIIVGVGNAWGANWSYTFSEPPTWTPASGTSRSMTINSATWSVSTGTATGSPTNWGVKNNAHGSGGIQFGNGAKNYYPTITLSTDYFSGYQVSAVTVNLLINGSVSTTITVTQGATTIGSPNYSTGSEWHDFVANTNSGTSGTLTLSISTTQAIYIHSISVTYTAASTCTTPPTVGAPNKGSVSLSNFWRSCRF